MQRRRWGARRVAGMLLFSLAAAGAGGPALAAPGAATAAPTAAPRSSAASLPAPGDGDFDPDDDSSGASTLPPGHPAIDSSSSPHAGAGGSKSMPGVFQPPEDTEREDASMPPGTIRVELRDADDKPVAGEIVTLGMLINSIAKGDSRKHVQATTDAQGAVTFSGLETVSNVAYRVSSGYQGGSFAATPFQLQQAKAMRVVLHVYPVTRDIRDALIVSEATVAAEMRDDRVQIEEVWTVYNLGRMAWQPDGIHASLPEGHTAFNAQASMSDQGVGEANGGVELHGTFPPGRHVVDFRWQLPWSGDKDVDFDVGMPPHAAIVRVMMPAMSDIKLEASGMPPSEVRHDAQGQSFLVTERRMTPDDARLETLSVGIHDLPTPGPGRLLATLLATCGVGIGFTLLGSRRGRPLGNAPTAEREAALESLANLERARAHGEVGPRTYERARRELIDMLARSLAETAAGGNVKRRLG